MPPADLTAVLLWGVLGIVNDEIRTLQKFDVALVARMAKDAIGAIPERFMVRDIGYRRPLVKEAVGDGGGGMIQVLRFDSHIAYTKEAFLQFHIVHAAAQIRKFDRKIGISHLSGQSFLQTLFEVSRGI